MNRTPARETSTPRLALERGESWWADCPQCRRSERLDLQKLVEQGRGEVGPDALRCFGCKSPGLIVRVRQG